MIKAALFDLDGTLFDTSELVFRSFEHVLKEHGIKPIPRDKISPHIGKTLGEMYQIFAPDHDHNTLKKNHIKFQYDNIHLVQPFPDMKQTLDTLRHHSVRLGIVTNRVRVTTNMILDHLKYNYFFEVIICGDETKYAKPHPQPIEKAISQLKVEPEEVVMIGDSTADIQAGKAAGTLTLWVAFGYHKNFGPHVPDFMVRKPRQIPAFII